MKNYDKIGIFVSGLCLIHCILLPFLSIIIPFLDEKLHILLFFIIITIGFYSFYFGFKKHQKLRPLILFIIGIIFLSLEIFSHYEVFTIFGSVIIIAAHLNNSYHCKNCNHNH